MNSQIIGLVATSVFQAKRGCKVDPVSVVLIKYGNGLGVDLPIDLQDHGFEAAEWPSTRLYLWGAIPFSAGTCSVFRWISVQERRLAQIDHGIP